MQIFHKPVEVILLALFLTTASSMKGQENEDNKNLLHINVISDKNITEAYFIGGMSKFYQYIYSNLKYGHVSETISDTVIAQFSVDTDGKVVDIEIIKDIDKSNFKFGKQIKKILNKSQKWTPGKVDGIISKTSIQISIPIKVTMSQYIDDDL